MHFHETALTMTAWIHFVSDEVSMSNADAVCAHKYHVKYRVLTEHFGVSDIEVRNWTNGPAWLTWSRGQN